MTYDAAPLALSGIPVYTTQFYAQLGQVPVDHFPRPQASFSLPQTLRSFQGATVREAGSL